jgi:hypothetical protein
MNCHSADIKILALAEWERAFHSALAKAKRKKTFFAEVGLKPLPVLFCPCPLAKASGNSYL